MSLRGLMPNHPTLVDLHRFPNNKVKFVPRFPTLPQEIPLKLFQRFHQCHRASKKRHEVHWQALQARSYESNYAPPPKGIQLFKLPTSFPPSPTRGSTPTLALSRRIEANPNKMSETRPLYNPICLHINNKKYTDDLNHHHCHHCHLSHSNINVN